MNGTDLTPKSGQLQTPDPPPPPHLGQAPYGELVRGKGYYLKRLLPEHISDTYNIDLEVGSLVSVTLAPPALTCHLTPSHPDLPNEL